MFLCACLLLACNREEDETSNSNSNDLFRGIYYNSLWYTGDNMVVDGNYISFMPNKIFYQYYEEGGELTWCGYWNEGIGTDVDYDGCIYSSVNTEVLYENHDSYTVMQSVSTSGNVGESCGEPGDFIISFEIIDESNMTVNLTYPNSGGSESFNIIRVENNFPISNCFNETDFFLWY